MPVVAPARLKLEIAAELLKVRRVLAQSLAGVENADLILFFQPVGPPAQFRNLAGIGITVPVAPLFPLAFGQVADRALRARFGRRRLQEEAEYRIALELPGPVCEIEHQFGRLFPRNHLDLAARVPAEEQVGIEAEAEAAVVTSEPELPARPAVAGRRERRRVLHGLAGQQQFRLFIGNRNAKPDHIDSAGIDAGQPELDFREAVELHAAADFQWKRSGGKAGFAANLVPGGNQRAAAVETELPAVGGNLDHRVAGQREVVENKAVMSQIHPVALYGRRRPRRGTLFADIFPSDRSLEPLGSGHRRALQPGLGHGPAGGVADGEDRLSGGLAAGHQLPDHIGEAFAVLLHDRIAVDGGPPGQLPPQLREAGDVQDAGQVLPFAGQVRLADDCAGERAVLQLGPALFRGGSGPFSTVRSASRPGGSSRRVSNGIAAYPLNRL